MELRQRIDIKRDPPDNVRGKTRRRTYTVCCAVFTDALLLAGCGGPQSALVPASASAARIMDLFWWMLAGAAVIWTLVIGLAVYAMRVRPDKHSHRAAHLLIIGAGAMLPTLVLAGLLAYGLFLMPGLRAPAPDGGLRISVSGERWWWRVRYLPPGGETVELANEIRLPVGKRLAINLTSPDVIHSFWIPPIGGKIDMIPGRLNRIILEPTQTGTFRGACAEYCGASHALMNFAVVVMEQEAFAEWLEGQAAPALSPADPIAERGQRLFLANGCGACHTVRGTPADGKVGPDLTHVGSRLTLGAGILPNEIAAFARWIAHTEKVKPSVRMPAFHMLPSEDLTAMATYLKGLR